MVPFFMPECFEFARQYCLAYFFLVNFVKKQMRILAYIIETLVLAFMVTAFIFMSKQPHIDVKKVKEETDKTSNENLDKLNDILLEDTTLTDSSDLKK